MIGLLAPAVLFDVILTFRTLAGVCLDPLRRASVFSGVLEPQGDKGTNQRPMVGIKTTTETERVRLTAMDDRDLYQEGLSSAGGAGDGLSAGGVRTEFEVWVCCDVGLSAKFLEPVEKGVLAGVSEGRGLSWERWDRGRHTARSTTDRLV